MRRYASAGIETEAHLRYLLRNALRNAPRSPHVGHAKYVGHIAGRLFRVREERREAIAHPVSPRFRTIQDRMARRDDSNAGSDCFWLMKYLEGFVLIPQREFDPEMHRGINYVVP